jgi:hypothetical protein
MISQRFLINMKPRTEHKKDVIIMAEGMLNNTDVSMNKAVIDVRT